MKVVAASLALLALLLGLAGAQAVFDQESGRFVCSRPAANFCAGDSLRTNFIIRCGTNFGSLANCNDNLAGRDPVGVKSFAPCYQTSPTAGDAVCTFNCIISQFENGTQILVPDCTPTAIFTPGASSSTTVPSGTAGPTEPAGSSVTAGPTGTASPPFPTGGNGTNPSGTPSGPPLVLPSDVTSGAGSRSVAGHVVGAVAALIAIGHL